MIVVLMLAGCAAQPQRPVDLRADLADCGTFDLKQGEELPGAALQCVVDAVRDGHRARLQETRPTTEGDPIVSLYVVERDGTTLVTRDTTQDKFGNYGIVRENCWGPVAKAGTLVFDRCEPA